MKTQEIVTKAVLSKGKKTTKKEFQINIDGIDNVLGCWVINHKFEGSIINNEIIIKGFYDINIWYSYLNNTKTNVKIENVLYEDRINLDKNYNDSEVIVRCLNQPNVIDVVNNNTSINLTIEKEMSIEIIGNKIVTVNITDENSVYSELNDFNDINEDYLK